MERRALRLAARNQRYGFFRPNRSEVKTVLKFVPLRSSLAELPSNILSVFLEITLMFLEKNLASFDGRPTYLDSFREYLNI
jgi:hypothetical protein